MKSWVLASVAVLFAMGHAPAARGCESCGCSDIGTGDLAGAINTIAAFTPHAGAFFVTVRADRVQYRTISDDRLRLYASRDIDTHSVKSLTVASLAAGFGVTDDLAVGVRLPYSWLEDVRDTADVGGRPGVDPAGNSVGIGDLSVLGKYRFANGGDEGPSFAGVGGMHFPTGRTDVKTRSGDLFETEHQPGGGSWDVDGGLAASMPLGGNFTLHADLLYTYAARGTQHTNLGDGLDFNVAVVKRLSGAVPGEWRTDASVPAAPSPERGITWDLVGEINGHWNHKLDVSGDEDPNSGGTVVFLSPGVRAILSDRCSAFLSVGVPIFQNLNGIQHNAAVRLTVGLTYSF